MRCLCCGKDIIENATTDEKNNLWHRKCIKKFFGVNSMPIIDISESQMAKLASDTVNKGLTVPGVQKKLSLHLSKCEDVRLTIVNYPTGYILKPQTDEYESLPEFEDLAMRLAEIVGIKTVPHALIKINNKYAYIYISLFIYCFSNALHKNLLLFIRFLSHLFCKSYFNIRSNISFKTN